MLGRGAVGGVDEILEACARGECGEGLRMLERMCPDRRACSASGRRGGQGRSYAWIERLLRSGVPDGRSRLILYVLSRYLVNVRGLSDEEAVAEIEAFIEASCRNHGNCSKIYRSWVRNVVKHVRRGGWRPWSLARIQRDDPELYEVVSKVALGGGGGEEKT